MVSSLEQQRVAHAQREHDSALADENAAPQAAQLAAARNEPAAAANEALTAREQVVEEFANARLDEARAEAVPPEQERLASAERAVDAAIDAHAPPAALRAALVEYAGANVAAAAAAPAAPR